MDGVITLDQENCGVGGKDSKISGDKMIRNSKIGNTRRKGLSDISNLKLQSTQQKQETIQKSSLLITTDYVEKLQQENMTLMKVIADRNRVIEFNGIEFMKLRTNFQKLQQQNQQLAHANSQMLAELNSSKDRLKVLQHDLACKNGLLMLRKLDLERKEEAATCQTGEVGVAECNGAEESMHENKDCMPCIINKPRRFKRESSGPSVVKPEPQEVESKRPCLRRQSARFKTEESVDTVIQNSNSTMAPQCEENVQEVVPTPLSLGERGDDVDATHQFETQECRRSSVGRPLRRAAEKIRSYKEIPINVKMRRN